VGFVVRITGSGMGCGDHWPQCNGHWLPAFDDYHEVIEWFHRLAALVLTVLLAALSLTAWSLRKDPAVSAPRGPLKSLGWALGLLALLVPLGAVVVKLDLKAGAVILHFGAAMALLAALMVTGLRASSLATPPVPSATPAPALAAHRTARSSMAALGITAVTLLLGGLTATTGASGACQGFPLCNGEWWPATGESGLTHIQWMHRLLAYLLTLHLIGLLVGVLRRSTNAGVHGATITVIGLVLLQIVIAAVMVLSGLPAAARGLHAATGMAVWVAVVVLAWKARHAAS